MAQRHKGRGIPNRLRRMFGPDYLMSQNNRWARSSRRRYRQALRRAGCPTSNRFYRMFRYT